MRIIIFRLYGYSNMLHPELQQICNFPVCFFCILYTEHTAILLSVFSDNNPDQVTDRSRFPLHTWQSDWQANLQTFSMHFQLSQKVFHNHEHHVVQIINKNTS